jgi:hypothetical protein
MLKISQIKGKSRWDDLRGFLLRLVSLLRYFKVATDPLSLSLVVDHEYHGNLYPFA